MRSAIVMSPYRGTPLSIFRTLARLGVGGHAGNGRQFVSWIHHRDFARAVAWLIDRDDVSGAVNLAAPNPLPNAEFLRTLRQTCGVPLGIPAPAWLLEIAAFFRRTETELLLKSRRVVPGRLLRAGFQFELPTWSEAARDLCHGGGGEW
jgi:NAD dependent epimerase/dehydratase family enzyme